jgi:hypothetical protein
MTLVPRRARLGSLLALALGALALLALPGLATAKHGSDSSGEHSNGMRNAGTVASFDQESGALTIDLREGGSVSALVGDETRILCVGPRGRRNGHERRHHRGAGKGHDEGGQSTASRRGRRSSRRSGHGANCTTDALVEGAIVKKARIETVEEDEVFEKILIAAADQQRANGEKAGCDDHGEGEHPEGDDEGGQEGPSAS